MGSWGFKKTRRLASNILLSILILSDDFYRNMIIIYRYIQCVCMCVKSLELCLTLSNNHILMWNLDYKESWAQKNWCFWTVVLEKTIESPLDCKEIQPVHPKGDQSWVFIGRTDIEAETPIILPPDVKSWLISKDPDAGKCWRQEKKGMAEDEMVW